MVAEIVFSIQLDWNNPQQVADRFVYVNDESFQCVLAEARTLFINSATISDFLPSLFQNFLNRNSGVLTKV